MTSHPNSQLVLRLSTLAIVLVFFQLVVFSQVPVFGAIADISPLVVMAVGLLCGPVVGASMGFAIGLMIDVALLQTMGLSSLVLIAVGHWAGRLRELRDPQSPLAHSAPVPPRSTPSATASASSCSAPTRPLAGSWSSRRSRRSCSTPCSRSRSPRWCAAGSLLSSPRTRAAAAAGPTRPAASRRSRRRNGLLPARGPPPADHAAARAARGRPGLHRARAVRDHLLPPVVPAGAGRRPVRRRRQPEPCARRAHPGAAR